MDDASALAAYGGRLIMAVIQFTHFETTWEHQGNQCPYLKSIQDMFVLFVHTQSPTTNSQIDFNLFYCGPAQVTTDPCSSLFSDNFAVASKKCKLKLSPLQ